MLVVCCCVVSCWAVCNFDQLMRMLLFTHVFLEVVRVPFLEFGYLLVRVG